MSWADWGFSAFDNEGSDRSPAEIYAEMERRQKMTDHQEQSCKKRIDALVEQRAFLSSMQDYYDTVIEREKAVFELANTSRTFSLNGYCKVQDVLAVQSAVTSVTDVYDMSFEDTQPDEQIPVALENNKFLTCI